MEIKNIKGEVLYKSKKTKLASVIREAIENNISLAYADLSNVDLSGADLSNAKLSHVDLSSIDLTDVDLTDVDLFDVDLSDDQLLSKKKNNILLLI